MEEGGGKTYRGFIVAIHVVSVIALTMLQSTYTASAQEDDDWLLLLIPQIVAANRVELSANSLAPLKFLTVTGRRFDPTAAIAVRFFDDQGYDVEVPVFDPTATSVKVAVPPFIDLSTGAFAAGTVAVQVVQKKGVVTRRSIAVAGFGIKLLESPTVPPGTVLLFGLELVDVLAAQIKSELTSLEGISSGALLAALDDYLATIRPLKDAVIAVIDDPSRSVNIGTFDGKPIKLNQQTLRVLDRLATNYFLASFGPGSGVACPKANNEFIEGLLHGPGSIDPKIHAKIQAEKFDCGAQQILPLSGQATLALGALFAVGVAIGVTASGPLAAVGVTVALVPAVVVIMMLGQNKNLLDGKITEQVRETVRDALQQIQDTFVDLFTSLLPRLAGTALKIFQRSETFTDKNKTFYQNPPPKTVPPKPGTAVFTGPFNVTGSFVGSRPDNLGCTFSVNFRGTITITLTVNKDGTVSGTAKVKGSFESTATSGCQSTTGSIDITAFVLGTISSITFEGGTVPAVSFTKVSFNNTATAITGTATFTFPGNASGKAATSVTLNK